jgi:hypothetical protein
MLIKVQFENVEDQGTRNTNSTICYVWVWNVVSCFEGTL